MDDVDLKTVAHLSSKKKPTDQLLLLLLLRHGQWSIPTTQPPCTTTTQVELDLSAEDALHPPMDTPSLAAIAQLTGLTALDLSSSTLPHLRPLSCLTGLQALRLNNVDCPGGGWRLHDMPAQLRKVCGVLCGVVSKHPHTHFCRCCRICRR